MTVNSASWETIEGRGKLIGKSAEMSFAQRQRVSVRAQSAPARGRIRSSRAGGSCARPRRLYRTPSGTSSQMGAARHRAGLFARASPTLVGMEACRGSQWLTRNLQAMGHSVRIMPAQFVKPFVKSQKNDTIDAEAIAEAVTRPTMRFTRVPRMSPDRLIEQGVPWSRIGSETAPDRTGVARPRCGSIPAAARLRSRLPAEPKCRPAARRPNSRHARASSSRPASKPNSQPVEEWR